MDLFQNRHYSVLAIHRANDYYAMNAVQISFGVHEVIWQSEGIRSLCFQKIHRLVQSKYMLHVTMQQDPSCAVVVG